MPMPTTRTIADQTVQTHLSEEYNRLSSLEINYHAQELAQDLVQKSVEFCFALRQVSSALLIGDQHSYSLRKSKVDEVIKSFENILTRLRVAATIISERKQALDKQVNDSTLIDKSEELKRLQKEV